MTFRHEIRAATLHVAALHSTVGVSPIAKSNRKLHRVLEVMSLLMATPIGWVTNRTFNAKNRQ